MKIKLLTKMIGIAVFVLMAFLSPEAAGEEDPGGCIPTGAGGGGCVPEIPASSASFLLVGLLGSILWLRNFFGKK